jgi:hypothetical protein
VPFNYSMGHARGACDSDDGITQNKGDRTAPEMFSLPRQGYMCSSFSALFV